MRERKVTIHSSLPRTVPVFAFCLTAHTKSVPFYFQRHPNLDDKSCVNPGNKERGGFENEPQVLGSNNCVDSWAIYWKSCCCFFLSYTRFSAVQGSAPPKHPHYSRVNCTLFQLLSGMWCEVANLFFLIIKNKCPKYWTIKNTLKIKPSTIPLPKDDHSVCRSPRGRPSPTRCYLSFSCPEPLRWGWISLSLLFPAIRSQATSTAAPLLGQCLFSASWGSKLLWWSTGCQGTTFKYSEWTLPLSAYSPNSSFLQCVCPQRASEPPAPEPPWVCQHHRSSDTPRQV